LKNHLLEQTGTTTDGKPVFSKVYKFYETHGLPLSVILQGFADKGWMVDWLDFYQAALSGGMKHDRILSKLEEAISDSYGKEFCQHVISTLDNLFGRKL
jgi:alanyl-tRNA synthetase